MKDKHQFWDSNLWVYLFLPSSDIADQKKKTKLLKLLENEPDITVSVQVLNEVANVLMKKYKYDESKVEEILSLIEDSSDVVPLTKSISIDALRLKKQFGFSWYDSLIVSAALSYDCEILLSEDMQNGLIIHEKLTILTPF
jgi:predicted nucleic acid-binding protein